MFWLMEVGQQSGNLGNGEQGRIVRGRLQVKSQQTVVLRDCQPESVVTSGLPRAGICAIHIIVMLFCPGLFLRVVSRDRYKLPLKVSLNEPYRNYPLLEQPVSAQRCVLYSFLVGFSHMITRFYRLCDPCWTK